MVKDVISKDLVIKEKKKSILQKELSVKEVLAVLGICGVIGVYGYFFVYPGYQEYKLAADNLEGINTQIVEYENRMSEMPALQEKLSSLQSEVKVKSRMLAHNMEDGMFMIGLSKVMDGVSVDLVDYSVDDVVPYETFYAIPTSITVRGDYRHVREVMYYLEEQKNMTQILDYSMETYIPEESSQNSTSNTATTTITADSQVYWTRTSSAYHKSVCTVLELEKDANGGEFSSGTSSDSGITSACQVCKPYTESIVSSQTEVENTSPKSTGLVEATFKFIMYSSENTTIELDNDDASTWKPGKYNPFTTTTR